MKEVKTGEISSSSVHAKNGKLYAVIQYIIDGKRKYAWRSLGLEEGASQSKIKKAQREAELTFTNELSSIAPSENVICNMKIYDYMRMWYDKNECKLQLNTRRGYIGMIEGRIKTYFCANPKITVGTLNKKHIEAFYEYMTDDGLCPNSIIRYHAILRKAFSQAYKDDYIETNPFDKVDRPRKNKFVGSSYSEEEWKRLLELACTENIYPPIVLAACMGLRRSEALGVRWSRINWVDSTVLLDTKIVECSENGKKILIPVEEMKNKTSRRTLYLPPMVVEMLKEEKAKQDLYRNLFRSSYSTEYEDYVCVNQLGELMKPSYLTQRFAVVLEKLGMRHIRFHDLRHTFASILINKQVPLINVSNFLGHSDISTTANIYAHLDSTNKMATANVIATVFEEVE